MYTGCRSQGLRARPSTALILMEFFTLCIIVPPHICTGFPDASFARVGDSEGIGVAPRTEVTSRLRLLNGQGNRAVDEGRDRLETAVAASVGSRRGAHPGFARATWSSRSSVETAGLCHPLEEGEPATATAKEAIVRANRAFIAPLWTALPIGRCAESSEWRQAASIERLQRPPPWLRIEDALLLRLICAWTTTSPGVCGGAAWVTDIAYVQT